MDEEGIAVLINKFRYLKRGEKRKFLKSLKIPESTFYRWQRIFYRQGVYGLIKKPRKKTTAWNKLLPEEEDFIVETAIKHTDLSSRLIAVKITDEGAFSVSEKTVQRILKNNGLLTPRPEAEMPAAKEWKKRTKKPDEIWQMDGTVMFVTNWGFYKYIPVLDDYSRYALTDRLMVTESGFTASDAMELALEEAERCGHDLKDKLPLLLTDNGPAFKGSILAEYLDFKGIDHIFGRPYHPQTQGKVERYNRTIKDKIYLVKHFTPDQLQEELTKAVKEYNARPHEALKNVSPQDVYAGRKEEILERRAKKKILTLERRKKYNLKKEVWDSE